MEGVKVKRIHHLGFVVSDLDETVRSWEALLGVKAVVNENPELKVRLASFTVAGIRFVFNESTEPGSRWEQFLQEHGEGLEHVALEVDNIDAACETARRAGLDIRFPQHKPIHGALSNFVEQGRLHGTTVEFIQPIEGDDDLS